MKRSTLRNKEVNAKKLNIGNRTIVFNDDDRWVGRGGTCLVYHAEIEGRNKEGKMLNKKIILKEFYPVLSDESHINITRDADGKVIIKDRTLKQENEKEYQHEYIDKRERFEASYDNFIELEHNDITANYVVKAIDKIKWISEI